MREKFQVENKTIPKRDLELMNSENFTKIDRRVQVQSNFKSTLSQF